MAPNNQNNIIAILTLTLASVILWALVYYIKYGPYAG